MIKANTMLKGAAALAVLAGLGVVGLSDGTAGAESATTQLTAIVEKNISCGGGAATVGAIVPGQSAATDAEITVTTNSVSGFTLTATAPGDLASGGNTIAYNTNASAGTQGWNSTVGKNNPTEWGSGYTSATIIPATGATWTHDGYSPTAVADTITVTVGTTTTTPSGDYEGSLDWVCAAR